MKIVITQEDVKRFSYADPTNCPMVNALKKALNMKNLSFYHSELRNRDLGKVIGHVLPKFGVREYKSLKDGEIKEFVTEYTPL